MVHFAGVCHSDVAFALGHGVMLPMEPIICGHEGAGYIVGLGEHTRSGPAPKIGDRVGIKMFADTCMTCDACLAGDEESCSAVCSLLKENVDGRILTVMP